MIIKKGNFDVLISEKSVDEFHDREMMKFWNNHYGKAWEAHTFEVFDKYLSKDYGYLDIGAWIGPTILYGAHLAKRVYCFEPDRVAYQYLLNNISENRDIKEKIIPFEFGISNQNTERRFYVGTGSSSMSSLKPIWSKKDSYLVTIYDFPTAMQKAGIDIQTINFIKIDIEGGEYDLIPSMLEYFEKEDCYPILYISLHAPFLFSSKWRTYSLLKAISFLPRKIIARVYNRKIVKLLSKHYRLYLRDGKKLKNTSELRDARAFVEIVALHQSLTK